MFKKFLGGSILALGGLTFYKYIQPDQNKLNLVFDIDSTIIHSKTTDQIDNINKQLLNSPNLKFMLDEYTYHTWKRPYSYFTLKLLSKFTNLYIFTAADKEYADIILNNIYPDIKFKNKLYREQALEGKDLDIFKLDNNKTILIDDNYSNHINKSNNFYHIYPYNFLTKCDIEMLKLLYFTLGANLFGISNMKKYYPKYFTKN